MWPFTRKTKPAPTPDEPARRARGMFSTHNTGPGEGVQRLGALAQLINRSQPRTTGMDSHNFENSLKAYGAGMLSNLPDALVGWYSSQTFIGYQMCAIISQHWLIDKACTMPGRDAIRHGFEIQVSGIKGDGADREIGEQLEEANRAYRLNWNMEQFVRLGRVFGIRIAFFKVESEDPAYYEKPFNPDGVTPGSYKGIVQVDPYWCMPTLDLSASSDPAAVDFYEPTWWIINGRRYHRSHLCIFRNSEVPDILKPIYQYGGMSVPQKIMERVYAAERTANEGPQLAMTKRTMVWNTDTEELLANQEKFLEHMQMWLYNRDNYGVKINHQDDTMQQFDTGLADLDTTIMTQYQLVAAGANVPATKLLGTTPKGFNSSGEYEEASYHEELETIQANDLTALVNRHHMLVLRSDIEPARNLAPGTIVVTIDWAPVDSPTAKEYAEINKLKAETDNLYTTMGAIDGMDVRGRLKADPNSEYTELQDLVEPAVGGDPIDLLAGLAGAGDPVDALGALAGAGVVKDAEADPLAALGDLGDPLKPLADLAAVGAGDPVDALADLTATDPMDELVNLVP